MGANALILDEPTTALDPHNREVIIELLKSLQEKLSFKMLFVTHDMKSAESLCDEICVIKNGKVIENVSLEKIVKDTQE